MRPSPVEILAITGPTGIGKSRAAVETAETLNGEIVGADSRQVYQGLEIGTVAPPAELRDRIPHHLVGVRDPRKVFSAGAYAAQAGAVIEKIRARGHQPVVVGGSGLYLRALMEGLFEEPEADPSHRVRIRDALKDRLRDEGLQALHAELRSVDPEWAARVPETDTQRILRGLEAVALHGVPLSALIRDRPSRPGVHARWCLVLLERERDDLYARLDARVERMLESGWIQEAGRLREEGIPAASPGLSGLGYDLLYRHLEEGLGIQEAAEGIRREHRRYAKRQITWFRSLKGAERIRLAPSDGPEETADLILAVWKAFR